MRRAAFACLCVLAACGRATEEAPAELPPVEPAAPVDVAASDELPGLAGPVTGVDFWLHPNVAFNSLIVVAAGDGVSAYNIEDGVEVARVPGDALRGVGVSYFGFGPLAAGVVATYDEMAGIFRFFGVDNSTRAFLPLAGGPAVANDITGFCFGRALTSAAPTLFVIAPGVVRVFNLALGAGDDAAPGVEIASQSALKIPADVAACAVETDGVLLLVRDNGDIYRLAAVDSFTAPFARSGARAASGLAVIAATPTGDAETSGPGAIALLDGPEGAVRLFDRGAGATLGAVRIAPAKDEETGDTADAAPAVVMGASGANLGGLYRNGAIALADAAAAPSLRLIPVNGVLNALSLAEGAPANLRGEALKKEEDSTLIIPTDLDED